MLITLYLITPIWIVKNYVSKYVVTIQDLNVSFQWQEEDFSFRIVDQQESFVCRQSLATV